VKREKTKLSLTNDYRRSHAGTGLRAVAIEITLALLADRSAHAEFTRLRLHRRSLSAGTFYHDAHTSPGSGSAAKLVRACACRTLRHRRSPSSSIPSTSSFRGPRCLQWLWQGTWWRIRRPLPRLRKGPSIPP